MAWELEITSAKRSDSARRRVFSSRTCANKESRTFVRLADLDFDESMLIEYILEALANPAGSGRRRKKSSPGL